MNKVLTVLGAIVLAAIVAWGARNIVIDAYMADDYVVTNSITNAKIACLQKGDAEACKYADAPSYTRLKTMCRKTLDDVIFSEVCPVGMIEGRDLGTDIEFSKRRQ
jgi:hypothetical protein